MTIDTSLNLNGDEVKEAGSYIPESLNPYQYQSITQILDRAVNKFADLPAFTSVGRTLTYREINEKSDQFAAYLQNHTDLMPGDRIAVQLPNVVQYPVVLFGAMKAGLIVVNTNPLYTPKELEHQFNDSGAKALVVFANMASNVEKILAKTSIKQVIVTQIADFHPPLKRLLINSVVKYVKKMVPPFQINGAISLNQALAMGMKHKD